MVNTKRTLLKFRSLGICLALFAATTLATATPITPGQSITAPGEGGPVGATILFQTNIFFSSATLDGILTSTVWTGDVSNSYGGLTFTYQFSIDIGSSDAASAITVGRFSGGFSNFVTDVSYQIPTSGTSPSDISRSPTGGGRNVTFSFVGSGYVLPGDNSGLLVVQTDATAWTFGMASVLDDVSTPNIVTLVPAVVPEPTTLSLASLGFISLVYFKRRKRTRSTSGETA